jgi:pimeloyl-ACP methyl ester carboxylesterase
MMRKRRRVRRCAAIYFATAILVSAAAHGAENSDASKLAGSWMGPLKMGAIELRLVLKISADDQGKLSAKLDSPDQGAKDIPIGAVTFTNGTLTAESKLIHGTFTGKLDGEQQALVGTWTQGPVSLPLTLKKTEDEIEIKRPQDPKPPLPYRSVDVAFDNAADEVRLAGTLTLPEGAGPFPAAILITGSGPQDRDEFLLGHRPFLVLADHLTRRGIAVLRYDDRGVAKSTGDFAKGTTQDFKRDAAAAFEFLRTRPEIDSKRIGLCGHSEGGLIAPLVASENPNVAFIVLMAGPGVTGEEIMYRQAALIGRALGADEATIAHNLDVQKKLFAELKADPEGKHLDDTLKELAANYGSGQSSEAISQAMKAQGAALGSPWFRVFLALDPHVALRKVKCPVLAINGERDLQVDPKQNLPEVAAALKEAGNRDATTLELPGLNHLFQTCKTGSVAEYGQIEETMAPAAMGAISDWIEARMNVGAGGTPTGGK